MLKLAGIAQTQTYRINLPQTSAIPKKYIPVIKIHTCIYVCNIYNYEHMFALECHRKL